MLTRLEKIAKELGIKIVFCDMSGYSKQYEGCYEAPIKTIKIRETIEDKRFVEHIILHELIHVTGSKDHLDRPSMEYYFDGDVYRAGEEQITHSATLILEELWGASELDKYREITLKALKFYNHPHLDFDEDLNPEVLRIVELLKNMGE